MTYFSMAGNTPDRTLSLIYATGDTATIPESHDRFQDLLDLLLSGAEDEEVRDLVDVMLAVAKRISQLSERVSIRNRQVLFDGDPIHGEISNILLELFEAGNPESLRPVVNFLEKASTNPSRKSVDDLYRWITQKDLIIHEDGDFLAYKGVRTREDGVRTSINEGTAFVDGEEVTGHIPNEIGSIVTMPRSDVDMDEGTACSTGLHAGTYGYATQFLRWHSNEDTSLVLVKINPRDVVAVPYDSSDQKLRVCRYVVQEVTEERRASRVYIQEPLPVHDEESAEDSGTDYVAVVEGDWTGHLDLGTDDDLDLEFDEDEDFLDDLDADFDEDEGGETQDVPEAFVQHLSSNEVLEALRQKLSGEDQQDQSPAPTEAEIETEKANEVVRDSLGRFTKESAVNAVRNSKGQFTKRA